ncbi:MAG TPA: hypothetical protein VNW46_06770 [Gemmatimonadaceae bacterium]|nr:hypothetical protein [Gemmatimonadaceae bacterium]
MTVVLAGCGESATVHYAKTICRQVADTAVIPTAIRAYIATRDPVPSRFLYVPATDSSPTEIGVQTLQERGPTYMYGNAPTQQAQIKSQLHSVGDYPSLLVWYHGATRTDETHAVVTLSGQYVGDPEDGKSTPLTHVAVSCDSAGWHAVAPAVNTKPKTVAGT